MSRCSSGANRPLSHAPQPALVFGAAQVLEVLLGAVGMRPGLSQVQRAANCTAVAMAALAGLVPLVRRTRSEGGAGDKVASKVLQLASCMLEDQVGGNTGRAQTQGGCQNVGVCTGAGLFAQGAF